VKAGLPPGCPGGGGTLGGFGVGLVVRPLRIPVGLGEEGRLGFGFLLGQGVSAILQTEAGGTDVITDFGHSPLDSYHLAPL
jgi:hypothetical protein